MTARALIITVLAMSCTGTLAACGASEGAASHATKAGRSQFVAFSVCMRGHGVPNFPDPGASGGIKLTAVNVQSPAFQTANRVCEKLLPGGGTGHASPSNGRRLLALAQCMRRRGLTSFPDEDLPGRCAISGLDRG